MHLYPTNYIRTPEPLETLNLYVQQTKAFFRLVTKISNYPILILNALLADIPSKREKMYMLEIIEKLYDKWPTTFCYQSKMAGWYPHICGGYIKI